MEPITTTALVLLGKHLAEKGLEKAFDTTVGEVSKNAINWITSLFTKDGKVKQELIELQEKPESIARLNAVKAIVERDLEDNPSSEKYLHEIYDKILTTISVTNSKNVNAGNINSGGGNVQLGDNHGN